MGKPNIIEVPEDPRAIERAARNEGYICVLFFLFLVVLCLLLNKLF